MAEACDIRACSRVGLRSQIKDTLDIRKITLRFANTFLEVELYCLFYKFEYFVT